MKMLRPHIVATEPRTAGGFHLHPPQMLLRAHHKVVSRAVPIRLGNHKPHAARLEGEGQLRNLPATLGMEIYTLHPARPKFPPQLKISRSFGQIKKAQAVWPAPHFSPVFKFPATCTGRCFYSTVIFPFNCHISIRPGRARLWEGHDFQSCRQTRSQPSGL